MSPEDKHFLITLALAALTGFQVYVGNYGTAAFIFCVELIVLKG